jgi:hypothetical protein
VRQYSSTKMKLVSHRSSRDTVEALPSTLCVITDGAAELPSNRAQSAIDDEIGAGDVTALVGSQEQRGGSDLLG